MAKLIVLIVFLCGVQTSNVFALSYGRYTLGFLSTKENSAIKHDGSTDNDRLNFYSSLNYNITDLLKETDKLTLSVRNKYNSFASYNLTSNQTSGVNYLQIRELNYASNLFKFLHYTIGRFNVSNADYSYVDGASVSYKITDNLKHIVFAGFDPDADAKSVDVKFSSKSKIFGTGIHYIKKTDSSLLTSSTGVFQKNPEVLEKKLYLYTNDYFSPSFKSRIYLDLLFLIKPKFILNYGRINYFQKWKGGINSQIGFFMYDENQYEVARELRDLLKSSSYKEAYFSTSAKFKKKYLVDSNFSYGKRTYDSLSKLKLSFKVSVFNILSKSDRVYSEIGFQNRFGKAGPFIKGGIDYYAQDYDVSTYVQYENEGSSATDLSPITLGEESSYYFSKVFLVSALMEMASQTDILIFNTYVFLSYRFGSSQKTNVRATMPSGKRL